MNKKIIYPTITELNNINNSRLSLSKAEKHSKHIYSFNNREELVLLRFSIE